MSMLSLLLLLADVIRVQFFMYKSRSFLDMPPPVRQSCQPKIQNEITQASSTIPPALIAAHVVCAN